ncbi:MAG: DUF7178 family protein [Burkholderiaceae bacterium]
MTAQHILAVYNLANVADRADGEAWYPTALSIAHTLADQYGVTVIQAVGVIAALSPRNKWARNLADAEAMIRTYQVDPEAAASVKVCTFGSGKAKALEILASPGLTAEDLAALLKGPKLQEFAACILGDPTEVCIDGHAYSIWLGDRVTLANVPSIGAPLRREIKAAYREAAAQLGIPAPELQAVTWCTWRRLHGVG